MSLVTTPAQRRVKASSPSESDYEWSDDNKEDFGTVELTDQMYEVLADVLSEERRPKTLRVQFMNPEILHDMRRTDKVRLLRCLSNGIQNIDLEIWRNGRSRMLSNEVDHATIMILSLAMRYKNHDDLLGELIGLSTPRTISLLKNYKSVTPLMRRPGMITSLAHAAARNLTQCREGNEYRHGSRSLLQHVPDFIASIITQMDLKDDHSSTLLGETFQQLAHNWPKPQDQIVAGIEENDRHEGQDRGYQVGLVLAGIKRSLHAQIVRDKKQLEHVKLFVQVALKALAATPVGGRAFTAFEPIADFTNDKRLKKLKDIAMDAWKDIYGHYLDNVETKIQRHGEYAASWKKYKEALEEVLDETDKDLKEVE